MDVVGTYLKITKQLLVKLIIVTVRMFGRVPLLPTEGK